MQCKHLCFKLFIVTCIIFFSFSAASGDSARVLVLPFDVKSDKDLSFLKEGVRVMLSTRLTSEGQVFPVSKADVDEALQQDSSPVNEEKAYALAAQLNAEYVAMGSITVFGESISTDARFLDVKNRKPTVIFSQFGKSQGDVLYHINIFAADVNEKVFGRKTFAYRKEAAQPAEEERRKHPETLIMPDRYGSLGRIGFSDTGLWRSRRYKADLNGVAVGDVDGDGNNETVFISDHRVYIYRHVKGQFIKVKEIEGNPTHNYLSVDVADINDNGTAEIFVTNHINERLILSSFVLEWNGSTFKKISSGERWYYRVLKVDGETPMLLGQKRGIDTGFGQGIRRLDWKGGNYVSIEKLKLPRDVNIFGFTFGDVTNTGQKNLIMFSKGGHLKVLDMAFKEIWEDRERIGGGGLFVEYRMEGSASIGDVKEMDREYLPQKIHVADLDQDGKKEVVIIRNQEGVGRIIRRIRLFNSGKVEGLVWDQLGLSRAWSTREFSGPIMDCVIADGDNDKKDELILTLSMDPNPILGDEKSYIIMMEIIPSEETKKR